VTTPDAHQKTDIIATTQDDEMLRLVLDSVEPAMTDMLGSCTIDTEYSTCGSVGSTTPQARLISDGDQHRYCGPVANIVSAATHVQTMAAVNFMQWRQRIIEMAFLENHLSAAIIHAGTLTFGPPGPPVLIRLRFPANIGTSPAATRSHAAGPRRSNKEVHAS
jgi:hypothetical protein